MTLAPNAPRRRRLAVSAGVTLLLLVLGVLALIAFGVGPSLFLFALAGVGLVDLAYFWRSSAAAV